MFKLDKKIVYFLFKALLLYIVWYGLYDLWLAKVGWLDRFFIDSIISSSELLLNIFNYPIFIYDQVIGIDGSHGVYIGAPCNGVDVMALFLGFIILFKGKFTDKLWYSALGLLVIHIANVLRVFILILLAFYYPDKLDFNHKYTFTILMYLLVFMGWVIWVNKILLPKSKNKGNSNEV